MIIIQPTKSSDHRISSVLSGEILSVISATLALPGGEIATLISVEFGAEQRCWLVGCSLSYSGLWLKELQ